MSVNNHFTLLHKSKKFFNSAASIKRNKCCNTAHSEHTMLQLQRRYGNRKAQQYLHKTNQNASLASYIQCQNKQHPLPSNLIDDASDFCKPYATKLEASLKKAFIRSAALPFLRNKFGAETASLYSEYLNRKKGDGLTPKVFDDPDHAIVKGFKDSVITKLILQYITNKVKEALQTKKPLLPKNKWIRFSLKNLVGPDVLSLRTDFNRKEEIPGVIAGGVSDSDAGLDERKIKGVVGLFRHVDQSGKTASIKMRMQTMIVIKDCIDFCPGGAGDEDEQLATITMSRLEASNEAYDLPFMVVFQGDLVEEDLKPSMLGIQ